MIGRAARWSYPNARLRHFVGRLADGPRFEDLARQTLADCLLGLERQPPLGVTWPELPGEVFEVGPPLYAAYEEHFLSLARHLDEGSRSVFVLFMEHVAIDDMKLLLRRLVGKGLTRDLEDDPFTSFGRSRLAPDVRSVVDLDGLEAVLAGTVFEHPFAMARATWRDSGNVLAFEVALDLDYHRRLHDAIRKLPLQEARAVGRLFRRQCDWRNLAWVLRYRFDYELQEVEIFNYALPFGLEIDDDCIKALARVSSPADALNVLGTGAMARFLRESLRQSESSLSIHDFEVAIHRQSERVYRDCLAGDPFGLLPFVAYHGLKEIERERLQRVLVGHQLALDPGDIVNCLWLEGEKRV